MATYTQITYQVIFSAKYREPVFKDRSDRKRMCAYMASTIRKKKCEVIEINGVDDHLHIGFSLQPDVALARLVKDVKLAASSWMKAENVFREFTNWQRGYCAITYSQDAIRALKKYIENQEEHHKKEDSITELKRLLREHNIGYDEKYFEKIRQPRLQSSRTVLAWGSTCYA